MNLITIIKKLSSLGERQGGKAEIAQKYILSILRQEKIDFYLNNFSTYIPVVKKAKLLVDGISVPCRACSFVGGKINDKSSVVSSLISSQSLISHPNINFNPKCDSISRSNFYFAPAVAINRSSLDVLVNSKKVEGIVDIKKTKVASSHIMVGNKKNPESIVFAHYDSIGPGAIDNASGVAVTIGTIINNKKLLDKVLFVFDGNEELSYDFPVYWGHGFRVFEKKYFKIMDNAKRIIVPDCLGYGETTSIKDVKIIKLAFPIKNIDKWKSKIQVLGGDIDTLMSVYHSELDTVESLNEGDILLAVKKLSNILK